MDTNRSAHVQLENVQKKYADQPVLCGIDLNIQQGEFIAIVGKSGCGKSTLLRLIAGLESYTTGKIQINGNTLTALNQHARMMFQDGRLLPWKNVLANLCIGLPKEKKKKASEALVQVGLENRMHDYPRKLSGGQKQRVALARALVHDPELLLLDEPLGALDAFTRMEMQELIESLWQKSKFTAILVTHDVEEAVALADRVIFLEAGKVAMDRRIDLERPRQRTHPAFTMHLEVILDCIKHRKPNKSYFVEKYPEPLKIP
jgi:sulfonate transport system ATP-binding protein